MSDGDRKLLDRGRDAERAGESDQQGAEEQERNFRMRVMARRWIQRKASLGAGRRTAELPRASAPLPSDVRARMEPQLGADLSSVKVGTDGTSAAAAEQLGARAFTTDGEVHFGAGEFAPGTKEGDRLLAHELTHVVQGQRSGVQRKAEHGHDGHDDASEHDVSQPHEPAEQEADAVGDHVADALHGDGGKQSGEAAHAQAPAQKAPAIGAKLHRRTIMRTAGPRPPSTAPSGKTVPPPGVEPGKQPIDIRAEARKKGGAAAQIVAQIDGDAAVAKVKGDLFADAAALFKPGSDPLSALQQAITAKPLHYLCQGPEITDKAVQVEGGINRYLDLPSVYGWYLKPAYKAAIPDPDDFVRKAANKRFDPNQHMDDAKPLSGKCPITWWSAGPPLPGGVEMGQVKKDIHVEDATYDKGAVRLEVPPAEFARLQKENGLHIYRPTAIDGAHQVGGSGAEALFKPAAGGATWGVTKGGAKECIMRPMPLGAFKQRRLIVPTSVPPAASAGAANGPAAHPPGKGKK